jgi:hypothetical protein
MIVGSLTNRINGPFGNSKLLDRQASMVFPGKSSQYGIGEMDRTSDVRIRNETGEIDMLRVAKICECLSKGHRLPGTGLPYLGI